jgi:hypothetical protein
MEHLPYYSNNHQYHRVDGKVEINGIQYQFVKQRVFHDSLELLCIPDRKNTELQTSKDDFYRLVNDLERAAHGKKSGSRGGSDKYPSVEYIETGSLSFQHPPQGKNKRITPDIMDSLFSSFPSDRDKPPKSC